MYRLLDTTEVNAVVIDVKGDYGLLSYHSNVPLAEQITRVGNVFERRLRAIAASRPIVKEIRGAGLMWGVDLTRDAAPVVPAALERGVVVNRTAETVVRLLPPLVITEAEADDALGRLDAALGAVGAAA